MANRRATFAKRQRETDLKDRAKAKDERRSQKRNEVKDTKGPQIAWDEAVQAVTSDDLPSLEMANQGGGPPGGDEAADAGDAGPGDAAPEAQRPAPGAQRPAPEAQRPATEAQRPAPEAQRPAPAAAANAGPRPR